MSQIVPVRPSSDRILAGRGTAPGTVTQDGRGHLYLTRHDGVRKLDDNSLYILQAGAKQLAKTRRAIRWLTVIAGVCLLAAVVVAIVR